jgi:toxin ParE1/3/4
MRIRYDPRALSDLQDIFDYIAADDSRAAARVVTRIEHAISRLAILPYSGRPGRKPGIRILTVPSLPYIVVHRVLNDFVEVLAIFHTARDHNL